MIKRNVGLESARALVWGRGRGSPTRPWRHLVLSVKLLPGGVGFIARIDALFVREFVVGDGALRGGRQEGVVPARIGSFL